MTNVEYGRTLSEVSIILNNMDEFLVNKIPEKLRKKIEEDKSQSYKFEYDSNKSLSEQKMLKTTKLYLTMLFLRFFCTEDEKKETLEIMKENESKYQSELQEKQKMYSTDNIFKKDKIENDLINNDEIEKVEVEEKDDVQMVVYKENVFVKIFAKIKNIFKIK